MIRILIADDHQVVRKGLRQVLETQSDMLVVFEGANGQEILDHLRSDDQADVLLTDISMPVMDGIALAEAVRAEYPHIEIVMLSIQEEDDYIQQAFLAGIKGYIFKTAHEEELIFAIRQVARHEPYLCAGLSQRMIRNITLATGQAKDLGDLTFSEREMEVLRLIAEGFTNEEAADKLFTSRRTVEGHRQSMIDKTGSRNSLALISFAMRHGLLS